MIVRLSLRNAVRHARHNLFLLVLFVVATVIFVGGNSLLIRSQRGVRDLFTTSLTADFVVAARSSEAMSIFGSPTPAIGEFVPTPRLTQHAFLAERIAALDEVQSLTPLLSGYAVMDSGAVRSTVPFFGIEPNTYFSVLSGLRIVAGRAPADGERGIMLTRAQLERLSRDTSVELGDEIALTAVQGRRFRIQAVPLLGVYSYPQTLEYVDEIALVDLTTARALNDIQTSVDADAVATDGPRNAAEIDDLFGGSSVDDDAPSDARSGSLLDDVSARLQEPGAATQSASQGAVHFLLVRGEESAVVRELAAEHDAEILDWRQAAGQPALLALLLQLLFNGGFVLLAVSIALGSINIILLSTYRRAREMGTLRALGAQRQRLASLFVVEHLFVALVGWGIGLIVIAVLDRALPVGRMVPGNPLLELLFSGANLRAHPRAVVGSLVLNVLLVLLAVTVPLRTMLGRSIVTAIREG
ncbi:MAG: FtsX-like permease family protein [Spirochaetota bacterium]